MISNQYLDGLRFDIRFPNRFAEYDPRRRNQVPFPSVFSSEKGERMGSGYSQTARAMFQFHEEYPIFVGRLKRRDVLLADVNGRGGRVLKEHDTCERKGVRDVSQRQGHAGKYQEFLRPGMFQNLKSDKRRRTKGAK
jgi:hypothetical protein